MNLILILVISVSVSAGVLLLLSRDVFRIIVGLAVLGSAANLIVFLSGRPGTLLPPVIEAGTSALASNAANPLPQALVLTAIVIGFALLAFALVLAARVSQQQASADVATYKSSEPAHDASAEDPDKPAVIEIEK
jgi:multicomponent Na+:H+ antiporter subunit C